MISPCVRHCTVDPERRMCLGCGRTLREIGGWLLYSDAERRAIMDALPARLDAASATAWREKTEAAIHP